MLLVLCVLKLLIHKYVNTKTVLAFTLEHLEVHGTHVTDISREFGISKFRQSMLI